MGFDRGRHLLHLPAFLSALEQAFRFFEHTPVLSLPLTDRFEGSGVYALYYVGGFDLYAPVRQKPESPIRPIYVGKAVPPGWRTARARTEGHYTLYGRLQEHTRSIRQAKNLHISEFRCRLMILEGRESDLIVPVEAEMIRRYRPLWNTVVDGFGNHDPGKGRYDQAPSEWDVLHPGRPWVERLTGTPPQRQVIIAKVRAYLQGQP